MTADQFIKAYEALGVSRRDFCRRIGISRRSGDTYALGRTPVPLTVQLAIRAVQAGLDKPSPNDKGAA